MAAEILTAVLRTGIGTGAGQRSFTGSFPWTPKAALFIPSRSLTDGVFGSFAVAGIGASDGTRQWALTMKSAFNASYTDCDGRGMTNECCAIQSPFSPIDLEFNFVEFIPGGVTVSVGDGLPTSVFVTIVFFGGADLEVHAGTAVAAASAVTDITAPGFPPDLLVAASGFVAIHSRACPVGFAV